MKCCVVNCMSKYIMYKENNKAFFAFPNDKKHQKKWLDFCGITAKSLKIKNLKVCQDHFLDDDIIEKTQCNLGLSRKLQLIKDAIPSIAAKSKSMSANPRGKRIERRYQHKFVDSILKEVLQTPEEKQIKQEEVDHNQPLATPVESLQDSNKPKDEASTLSSDRVFLKEFISIYKTLPALWRIKSEQYHNKKLKRQGYEKLLLKLKEKEPDATIETVKKKINCIRSSYRRESKKVRNCQELGTDTDDIYETTLWYFNDLDFLKDQEIQTDGMSSLDLEDDNIQKELQMRKRKRSKREVDRNQLLTRAVECLENSTQPKDEASILSATWETLYRNLSSNQKLFANKAIIEVLYQGVLGKLTENSYKAFERPPQS